MYGVASMLHHQAGLVVLGLLCLVLHSTCVAQAVAALCSASVSQALVFMLCAPYDIHCVTENTPTQGALPVHVAGTQGSLFPTIPPWQ